jgi:hypothetical protein
MVFTVIKHCVSLKIIWTGKNGIYIYIYITTRTCRPLTTRCVKEDYTSLQENPNKTTRWYNNRSIPKQSKWFYHQQWKLEAKVTSVVLKHRYEHLDFVQKLSHGVHWISEYSKVPFVPHNPHTSQPDELQKGPPSTETANWISELNKMIWEAMCIYCQKFNPSSI